MTRAHLASIRTIALYTHDVFIPLSRQFLPFWLSACHSLSSVATGRSLAGGAGVATVADASATVVWLAVRCAVCVACTAVLAHLLYISIRLGTTGNGNEAPGSGPADSHSATRSATLTTHDDPAHPLTPCTWIVLWIRCADRSPHPSAALYIASQQQQPPHSTPLASVRSSVRPLRCAALPRLCGRDPTHSHTPLTAARHGK